MQERNLKRIFSKNKSIVFREEEEFGLLFSMETGRVHKLNKKAAVLWRLIDSEKTVQDIINEIKKEYGEDDTLSDDVWQFLVSLEHIGYISS